MYMLETQFLIVISPIIKYYKRKNIDGYIEKLIQSLMEYRICYLRSNNVTLNY